MNRFLLLLTLIAVLVAGSANEEELEDHGSYYIEKDASSTSDDLEVS